MLLCWSASCGPFTGAPSKFATPNLPHTAHAVVLHTVGANQASQLLCSSIGAHTAQWDETKRYPS